MYRASANNLRLLLMATMTAIVFPASATVVWAQNLSVSDVMTMSINAGEAQSTIVPPGLKTQCQQGRFVVTNDRLRPPSSVVSGRNLDQTSGPLVASTFDMGALGVNYNDDYTKSSYWVGTNDHDLVTLSNGDVLYITGAWSRMSMNPKGHGPMASEFQMKDPNWFKKTAREMCTSKDAEGNCRGWYAFGPNARSVVLTFRSTDCGEHFEFISEMDPVRFGGGTCALPQLRGSGPTTFDYDMGGSDGQLIKVDPANDHIYLTFPCVGYHADPAKLPEFVIDSNNKINQTLVLMSDSAGSSWKSLGYIGQIQ